MWNCAHIFIIVFLKLNLVWGIEMYVYVSALDIGEQAIFPKVNQENTCHSL